MCVIQIGIHRHWRLSTALDIENGVFTDLRPVPIPVFHADSDSERVEA